MRHFARNFLVKLLAHRSSLTLDTADVVEESWQQAAKRRKAEKQEEVRGEQGKQEKRSFGNPSVQLKMRACVHKLII